VLSVIAMELFRFASRSVLAGNGLGGVGIAINYFMHQDYGASFSSSFHFGEVLSGLVQELFRGEFSYYGMGLLGLSLIVPSQNPKELLPSKTSQMFCVIAALSPLLWFLFFPAASLVHRSITGWQVFYFVWFLTVATLPGFWPANSSRFAAPKQPSRN